MTEGLSTILFEKLFKKLTEPPALGYPVDESCLSRLRVQRARTSHTPNLVKFNDVFDKDMKIKDLDFVINNFASNLGVTQQLILLIMYSFAASRFYKDRKMLLRDYSLDVNILAWMIYHSVPKRMYIKSINFKHKGKSYDNCVVCHAKTNIVDIFACFKITYSPDVYTGGREPLAIRDKENYHYVVWTYCHEAEIDSMFMSSFKAIAEDYPCEMGFSHGLPQYGHPHMHMIGGDYFDIRAEELLKRVILINREGTTLELSELFHPFDVFYNKCGEYGKDCIITALVYYNIALDLELDIFNIYLFCKINYKPLCQQFRQLLEY